MPTLLQLTRNSRVSPRRKTRTPAFKGAPQRRGHCLKVFIMSPKKPNSAMRKVARIHLTSRKNITAYIQGQGHNIQRYSSVIITGGHHRDCPGVRYHIQRGLLDAAPLYSIRKKRSKYGVKLIK